MNKKIRVVQYGLGPIGCRSVQYLTERGNFDLVGAIDSDARKVGVDVGELAELPKALGLHVTDDSTNLLREVDAEVVVLTTTSSLEQIRPQVLEIISCGKNVVSTCEELMYPSVLSTGVNPGFLMDFLPLVMTGVCRDVEKVTVERIQDAQYRRLPFQKKIGAGLTVREFEERVKAGNLRHVGLTESMHLLASGLGWKLDRTEDIIEPVIASQKVSTANLTIEPNKALGVNQVGRGYIGDKELITLVFRATIGEPKPRDRVFIQGTPTIDMAIEEGVNGDTATCAIIVNAIPVVIQAPAGLRTMADINPISFFE